MRKAYGFVVSGGLLVFVTTLQAGCWTVYDDYYLPLTNPALARDGGTDGGDSGPPPSCIPSHEQLRRWRDTCGVFVSSDNGDDTTGKGTQTAPYKTHRHGARRRGSTIYACAGTTPYSEALAVDKPVTLFGALDCATWAYDAANKTQLTAASDAVPLTLSSSASGSEVNDFAITAADATKAGGSSIAVLDNGADLALENVDLAAGAGQAGTAGRVADAGDDAGERERQRRRRATRRATTRTSSLAAPEGPTPAAAHATNGGNGGKGVACVRSATRRQRPAHGDAEQRRHRADSTRASCNQGRTGAATAGTGGTPAPARAGSATSPRPATRRPTATLGGSGHAWPGRWRRRRGAGVRCPNGHVRGPERRRRRRGRLRRRAGQLRASRAGAASASSRSSATLTLTTVTITTKAGGAGGARRQRAARRERRTAGRRGRRQARVAEVPVAKAARAGLAAAARAGTRSASPSRAARSPT